MDTGSHKLQARRKHQTRTEIVHAAFELFGKFGYEQVSMDSVASAAGVSRATLFNYFPKKDLILREIAAARADKLKAILAEFTENGHEPNFENIVDLILRITEENGRITASSKKLFLETFFRQVAQGTLLAAREGAVDALAVSIAKIPGQKKRAKVIAETLFAVFLATMLEWLMREGAPQQWLVKTMRQRLHLLREGVA